MSNPVPPSGGAYPPPPAQGQPGFPPSGQAGFPAGPEQFGQMPAEQKKSGKGRLVSVLGVLLAVVVGVGIKFGLYSLFSSDKTKEAKVGDCVAAQGKVAAEAGKMTQAAAKVVDCTSSDAAYTVVGRVDGVTSSSSACDKFFTDEKADYFVYSSGSGKGYLLCLKSKKA